MSQRLILELLDKMPTQWISTREISDKLGISMQAAMRCLNKLRKSQWVEYSKNIERNGELRYFVYKAKVKLEISPSDELPKTI